MTSGLATRSCGGERRLKSRALAPPREDGIDSDALQAESEDPTESIRQHVSCVILAEHHPCPALSDRPVGETRLPVRRPYVECSRLMPILPAPHSSRAARGSADCRAASALPAVGRNQSASPIERITRMDEARSHRGRTSVQTRRRGFDENECAGDHTRMQVQTVFYRSVESAWLRPACARGRFGATEVASTLSAKVWPSFSARSGGGSRGLPD